MEKTALQVRVNSETKKAAAKTYENLGLTLSDAVNVFLTMSVKVGGFPFDVKSPAIDDNALWQSGVPMDEAMQSAGITMDDVKGWEDTEIE